VRGRRPGAPWQRAPGSGPQAHGPRLRAPGLCWERVWARLPWACCPPPSCPPTLGSRKWASRGAWWELKWLRDRGRDRTAVCALPTLTRALLLLILAPCLRAAAAPCSVAGAGVQVQAVHWAVHDARGGLLLRRLLRRPLPQRRPVQEDRGRGHQGCQGEVGATRAAKVRSGPPGLPR